MSETLKTIAHWHTTYRRHHNTDYSALHTYDGRGDQFCEASISHTGAIRCCLKIQDFINLIANMKQDGEYDFDMTHDDAVSTLNALIELARTL